MTDTNANPALALDDETTAGAPAPASERPSERPSFRAWLVIDREDSEGDWIELAGLWPTKSGTGYRGALKTPVNATQGRIVILPATFKKTEG